MVILAKLAACEARVARTVNVMSCLFKRPTPMVNTAGLAVTTKSLGFWMVMVYFSATGATFVTVRGTSWVPTNVANVIDGMLRSVALPTIGGHAVLVAPSTSRGVDIEQRNFT